MKKFSMIVGLLVLVIVIGIAGGIGGGWLLQSGSKETCSESEYVCKIGKWITMTGFSITATQPKKAGCLNDGEAMKIAEWSKTLYDKAQINPSVIVDDARKLDTGGCLNVSLVVYQACLAHTGGYNGDEKTMKSICERFK